MPLSEAPTIVNRPGGVQESSLHRPFGAPPPLKEATLAQYPNLRKSPELTWGFKLVDKANPQASFTSDKVTIIPEKGSKELEAPVEKVTNALKNPAEALKGLLGNN